MRRTYEQLEAELDAREGLVRFGDVPLLALTRRLQRALPTTSHARALIDALLDRLGDDGRLDPYDDGSALRVHRADPPGWWMMRPIAIFADGAEYYLIREDQGVPVHPRKADEGGADPAAARLRAPLPRPDLAPKGRRATLSLRHGEAWVELRYDDAGLIQGDAVCSFGDMWANERWDALWPPSVDPSTRPPQIPPPPWLLTLPEETLTVDALAEHLLTADPGVDPVRIRMPVDAPGGLIGTWERAMFLLRRLAWDRALPTTAGVVVIDTFRRPADEACVGFGPDLATAEAAWLAAEPSRRPRHPEPPRPPPAPAPPREAPSDTEVIGLDGKRTRHISSGTQTITIAPVVDIPWPIPGPHTSPAVAVRMPALPVEIPPHLREAGFSWWRRTLARSGHCSATLVRDDPDGTVEIGALAIDLVDPDGLDAALDAGHFDTDGSLILMGVTSHHPFVQERFAVWSPRERRAMPPRVRSMAWNPDWPWAQRSPEDDDLMIVRVRRR